MRWATVVRARQEAGAHAIGDVAQPQIEARGLDLVGHEIARRQNAAVAASAAIMRSGRMPLSSTEKESGTVGPVGTCADLTRHLP